MCFLLQFLILRCSSGAKFGRMTRFGELEQEKKVNQVYFSFDKSNRLLISESIALFRGEQEIDEGLLRRRYRVYS